MTNDTNGGKDGIMTCFKKDRPPPSGKAKLQLAHEKSRPCYTWFMNRIKPIPKNGVKIVGYASTGCLAMGAKWKKQQISCENHPLPLRKVDGTAVAWIDKKNQATLTFCYVNV
uniref:Uncharacterized protein n=1 Tax=Ditylenchus dipsaci TaxID=166011 RepID=A0A915CX93_9BILA